MSDFKAYLLAMVLLAAIFMGALIISENYLPPPTPPTAVGNVAVPTLLSHPQHPQISAVLIMSDEDTEIFMNTPGTWRVSRPAELP